MIRAVYPGSFDPVTFGHIDVIKRASRLVDELVVGVLHNKAKIPLFSVEERVKMLNEVFEYELQMAQTNHKLSPDIETVFLTTGLEYSYLSSTMVKEVAAFGGDITRFVPEAVACKIQGKMKIKGECKS